MPFVANPRKATTDLIGELLVEFAGPLPHGFMADDDATGGQQLLDHTQPERERKYSQTAWLIISEGNR